MEVFGGKKEKHRIKLTKVYIHTLEGNREIERRILDFINGPIKVKQLSKDDMRKLGFRNLPIQ